MEETGGPRGGPDDQQTREASTNVSRAYESTVTRRQSPITGSYETPMRRRQSPITGSRESTITRRQSPIAGRQSSSQAVMQSVRRKLLDQLNTKSGRLTTEGFKDIDGNEQDMTNYHV